LKWLVVGILQFYEIAPLSDLVPDALTIGIRKLKGNGTIEKVCTESGFFNQTVKDWAWIN